MNYSANAGTSGAPHGTEVAGLLGEVAIFSDLDPDEHARIAGLLSRVELKHGTRLFSEGDPGSTLYIVESGRCAITVQLPNGQELDITEFTRGDFFGEMSIFEDAPRSASCYAREDAVLLSLREDDLHALIERHPALAIKVMFRMMVATAERLTQTNGFLSDMLQWGETARKRAVTDAATGLFNRRFLDEVIEEQFQKARTQNRSSVAVVMIDLDHFNTINEEYGHTVGDEVINAVVPVFREHFRDSDIVSRYGGDEFAILMPNTDAHEASTICNAVCREVASLRVLADRGGNVTRVTTSYGIAAFPKHGTSVAEVWERADQALYYAKRHGRNQVTVASPSMSTKPVRKHDITTIGEKNRVVTNIIEAFIRRERFLIVGHENPDEDCIASMVGVGLLLSKLSKPVSICTTAEMPPHYQYLLEICRFNSIGVNAPCCEHAVPDKAGAADGSSTRASDDAQGARIDTVIICDTAKPEMLHTTPAVERLLNDPDVLKIEIDHHLDADSRYSGDEGHCLVAAASSAAELVGYLGCKLSSRVDVIREYDIEEVFSRNMVLAVLTGIVGDTQMGKFIKSRKEHRFYNTFSDMFNRLLAQKTTKQTNFNNMKQVYSELRSLSASQEELYEHLIAQRRLSRSVAYIALDADESAEVYSRFEPDTVVSVARAIADELAEESGRLSLIAYYDPPEVSDLVQFRMRRAVSFKDLDLRSLLERFELANGGGHEGAIGFRVPKLVIEDFAEFVEMLVTRTEALIE